jgi:uncharacterized damage-inducible protein DinB
VFGLEGLGELYRHMEWADSRVWGTVIGNPAASGDSNIRERLFHLHYTQRSFFQLWTQQKFDRYDPARFATAADLRDWVREYYRAVTPFIAQLDEARLGQMIAVPWARLFEKQLGRPAQTVTLAETIFQVTAHSNYHRAQINTRLRQLGVDPPMVDYIAWLWTGRPESEWR